MKKPSKFNVAALLVMVVIAITLTACSNTKVPVEQNVPSKSESENEKFSVNGLGGGNIEVTVEELKAMQSVTRDVVSVNSSGEEKHFKVTGVLFEDVLKKHGTSQKELKGIRLIAGDGYSIEVAEDILKNRDIILTYMTDDEPLDEKSKPVRVVIPEERAMYWVRNVVNIEILESNQTAEMTELILLETAIAQLPQNDYTYYESKDKAVKVHELINSLKIEAEQNTVMMKAADDFEKNEQKDVFLSGYIKITGKDAPMFLSPDLPKGMYVKNISWFSYGNTAVFSFDKGFEVMEHKAVDDKEGIPIQQIFEKTSLVDAASYRFTATDGYSVEVGGEDVAKGIMYRAKDGSTGVCFDGLPKNTQIKSLLSIEAVR